MAVHYLKCVSQRAETSNRERRLDSSACVAGEVPLQVRTQHIPDMGQSSSTPRRSGHQTFEGLRRTPSRSATAVASGRAGNPAPPPSRTILLKHIQMLATLSHDYGDIADAAIYIKGNVIHWVGATTDIPPELRIAETVLSLTNRVVIPGLVCCHHHMYQVSGSRHAAVPVCKSLTINL